jgi:hypothetical protein
MTFNAIHVIHVTYYALLYPFLYYLPIPAATPLNDRIVLGLSIRMSFYRARPQ